jgi:23S rRNA (guanine1835-N2)-methyltransferase
MPKPVSEIKRYPLVKNDPLQGWDSADELILEFILKQNPTGKRILIINDHFGAISCGLEEFDCTTYTDSNVSTKGIKFNSQDKVNPISDLSELSGQYDYVLLQIPKNLSFFEDILCHLTEHLHSESKIICASMVKHLSPTSFELLQKYIGATTTSLAKKKARLIFATFQKGPADSPYPLSIKLDSFEKPFINHSNLFSRDKLDIGTRFFLEHIPRGDFKKILDLGCANGVIGIKARMLNPSSDILFSDESKMAIESAKINFKNYFDSEPRLFWTNCFEEAPEKEIDLVLCNPPFHQQNTIGDFIAWQMFKDAYQALKIGGKLRVIGNSHLGYQIKLKKIFGNSKIVATNKKFVICESTK